MTAAFGHMRLDVRIFPPCARESRLRDVKWRHDPCRPALLIGLTLKRLFSATANSLRGLIDGVKTEPAVREEALLLVAALFLGAVVAPSAAWYVAMIATILLVLAVEFLNTAVEKLADHVTREQDTDIRRIKDFGSAGVGEESEGASTAVG